MQDGWFHTGDQGEVNVAGTTSHRSQSRIASRSFFPVRNKSFWLAMEKAICALW